MTILEERSIKDTINDKLERVKRNKKMYGGKKITPVTNFKEFVKEIHNIDHLTNQEFVKYMTGYREVILSNVAEWTTKCGPLEPNFDIPPHKTVVHFL